MQLFCRSVSVVCAVCALALLWSARAEAQGAGPSKAVPPAVTQALAAGQSQDLIILLDDAAVESEAAALRGAAGLAHDNAEILTLKAARYADLKQDVLAGLPPGEFQVLRDYSHLPMMFMRFQTSAALTRLLERVEVVRVYEEEISRPLLSQSLPLINQPATAASGKVGTGTSVNVIDTGVDYTRTAFGSCTAPGVPSGCKVIAALEFATNDNSLDDSGHGTNVAGTVLGVAPDTRIIASDVFEYIQGCGNCAYSSVVINAINWSISNKAAYNIVAMNLSLGSGGYTSPCSTSVYATPFANAKSAGILGAAASGNDAYTNRISSPGCVPAAVSVGAVYDSNVGARSWSVCSDPVTYADLVTCFSNSASFLTMLAPGSVITAAGISMSGTSQATPHIAGAAAVLRGAFPSETVDQTISRMTSTGVPVTDPKNSLTKPRLDLLAASGGGGTAPDLVVSALSNPPASAAAGGSFSVTDTTANQGTATAGASTTRYRLSLDSTITGADPLLTGSRAVPSLAAGANSSGTTTVTIPSSLTPGTYYLGACADDLGVVAESNETNNCRASTTTIQVTGGGGTFSISGTVSTSGGGGDAGPLLPAAPLAGVTMTLTGAASGTTTTDSNGNYTFTGLANGNYTVTPSLSGYVFTPTSRNVTVSGANVTGQNFTATAVFTISGTVTASGGGGLSGVTMTLSGSASATTTTNASGNYTFTVANGSYTVTPSLTGYSFTPANRSVTVNNANVTGQNFTGTPTGGGTFSISGTVSTSGGGGDAGPLLPAAPLAGVTMTLTGTASATATTDGNGNYTFTGLANGNYTVTPSLTGYVFSPTSRNVTVSGANVTGQNFAATAAATYTISGTVTASGGGGLSGVTMTLSGSASATTTTNASGNYSFTVANGSYTITPSLSGYTFTPTSRNVTVSGANVTGQNFTGTATGGGTSDLVVSALSNPPASAAAGGSFAVTDTTANQGTATAGASTTRYRLSLDSTITGADPLLTGSRAVPSLAAGANSSGTTTVTIPASLTPGTYYLGACADDLGAVAESNETNNCRASTTTIQVTGGGGGGDQ